MKWLRERWKNRYWIVFPLLICLGVWQVREDGGYWYDGRIVAPRWLYRLWYCFTHDTDTAPERPWYSDDAPFPVSESSRTALRTMLLADALDSLGIPRRYNAPLTRLRHTRYAR